MGSESKVPGKSSSAQEVQSFLDTLAKVPAARAGGASGRLIFALDATASRQPTWDRAAQIQGEMFVEAAALGGLEIQLCFYRGFGEFKVSPWLSQSADLLALMTSVSCRAGRTQIRKVLVHTLNETRKQRVSALVFVGDCVEEDIDSLAARAGELGVLGVPAFMFHEGADRRAALALREIARLTNGAYCRFDAGSAHALRALLKAVAIFAAGGRNALDRLPVTGGTEVRQLARQLRGR